jgi:hypothetical protein
MAGTDRGSVSVICEYMAWAVVWLLLGSAYGTLAAWKLAIRPTGHRHH